MNEVKRVRDTAWSIEQRRLATNSVQRTAHLHELKDREGFSTGAMDTLLNQIETKGVQFDEEAINILWIVSENIFCQRSNVEDCAWFYTKGWATLPADQQGKAHRKPNNLNALGWLWDARQWTLLTDSPWCFSLEPFPNEIRQLLRNASVRIKEQNGAEERNDTNF